MVWRNKYANRGRPKKMFKKSDDKKHYALGGIPMTIVNGKIKYAQMIPNKFLNWFADEGDIERDEAVLPVGDGSFIRRHIYEVRFDIEEDDESDDERRKREYKEWWEKRKI